MPQEGQTARGPNGQTAVYRNGRWVVQTAPNPQPPVDPTFQYEGPQAAANLQQTQTQAAVAAATAPATIAEANAEAALKSAQAAEIASEQENVGVQNARKAIRQAYNTDNILQAIRNARRIVQNEGGTGAGSLLASIPGTTARKLKTEIDPITGNLAFDRLQQMRDESKTGGAVGNVSDNELSLLASTVASLDTGVDSQTFLNRLDTIERSFIGQQLILEGIDPQSPEGRAAYKNDFGYSGVFEGESPQADAALLDPNATTATDQFPEAYQNANLRYLRENWGNIDPAAYTRFRAAQDEANGFGSDLAGYADYARQVNEFAQRGGSPDQLSGLERPEREVGALEQGLNRAAQSIPGTVFANAGNALTAGIMARAAGQQEELNLLREVNPVSSFAGEALGSGLGAYATGGALTALGRGGSLVANPVTGDLLHSSIYGATQDENPLRGAAVGAIGAAGGEYLGRTIGDALPNVFAPSRVNAADASVPTREQVSEQAAELYNDIQQRGVAATADETAELGQRLNRVLDRNGQLGGTGERILDDGPTNQAVRMIDSFSGQTMTPQQALRTRQRLGEGLTAQAPQDRRIAGQLLDEFDDWADPVLPGHANAREVAQRNIQARQIENLNEGGLARGLRQKGNDQADALRTAFGRLDERVIGGTARLTPETAAAVSNVARGDRFTNAMRALGKFGFGNPLTSGGVGVGGAASLGGFVDPLYAGGAISLGALGTGARRLAENQTLRAAREAEFTALGGPDYVRLLEDARELAARRSGALFGSTGVATGSNITRDNGL